MESRFGIDYTNLSLLALTTTATMLGWVSYRYSKMKHDQNKVAIMHDKPYSEWKEILENVTLPAALVDLDAFNSNLKTLTQVVEKSNSRNQHKKTIRIATKSIRVPELIKYALDNGGPLMKGVMCYSAQEAYLLFTQNTCNDFLIAYPTVQAFDLEILYEMHKRNAKVSLVVDSVEQMQKLDEKMQDFYRPFHVVIELDTSIRFWNGFIHLGAIRSPIHSIDDLRAILKSSKQFKHIEVVGVMAYESAVAGLSDKNPHKSTLMNSAANLVRRVSADYAATLRAQVPQVFAEEGCSLQIFNGGGTGSIDLTAAEDSGLTELTFGSGLLNPHLFDYYSNLEKLHLKPSLYFVIPVVRQSNNGKYVTCFEGGYQASGEAGQDKSPIVVSPRGLESTKGENFGEVQTPFLIKTGTTPSIGNPVICRPAKAEMAKLFNTYTLFFKPENNQENAKKWETKTIETYRKFGI